MKTSRSVWLRTRPAWAALALLAGWLGGRIGPCQASAPLGQWTQSFMGLPGTFSVDSLSPLATYQVGPLVPYSLPAGDLLSQFSFWQIGAPTVFALPSTAIPAGGPGRGLGLSGVCEVDAVSFGDDLWWPSWPVTVTFSVDRNAVGRSTTARRPRQLALYSDVFNEAAGNQAAGDLFISGAWIGWQVTATGGNRVIRTPGWNYQWADEDGVPVAPFAGQGLMNLTALDGVDGYEESSPAQVDPNLTGTPGYQTWSPSPGITWQAGGPVFFSVNPATATALASQTGLAVGPGDILAAMGGSWWIYAPAAQLGLTASDDIDALALNQPLTGFQVGSLYALPGSRPRPVLFSVSPASPLVGTTCPLTGGTIGPGDILERGPSGPQIFIPASGLGLLASDNLDALETRPGLDLWRQGRARMTRRSRPQPPPPGPPPPLPPPPPGSGGPPLPPSPPFRIPAPGQKYEGYRIAPGFWRSLLPESAAEEIVVPDALPVGLRAGLSEARAQCEVVYHELCLTGAPGLPLAEAAYFSLVAALNPSHWVDDSHLDPPTEGVGGGGGIVYGELTNAALALRTLTENPAAYGLLPHQVDLLYRSVIGVVHSALALAETSLIEGLAAGCPEGDLDPVTGALIAGHEAYDLRMWEQCCSAFGAAWTEAQRALDRLLLIVRMDAHPEGPPDRFRVDLSWTYPAGPRAWLRIESRDALTPTGTWKSVAVVPASDYGVQDWSGLVDAPAGMLIVRVQAVSAP